MSNSVAELKKHQFFSIVEEERIFPVYQPIVSLQDGEIMGYEILSRFNFKDCIINMSEFFHMAAELDLLWRVEELWQRKVLQNVGSRNSGTKLFVNVTPEIMKDSQFQESVTRQYLKQYKIYPEDIVFEIAEHNSIEDEEKFKDTIKYYQKQLFQIAVDNFSNGYAGINRVYALEPEYIKIDMNIVRDIDTDNLKRTLVESMIQFCRRNNIHLIAEGIETREELNALIHLGIPYGQGYYISHPSKTMDTVPEGIIDFIKETYDNIYTYNPHNNILGIVGYICVKRDIVGPDVKSEEIYNFFLHEKPSATEVVVVDEYHHVLGVLTKAETMSQFGKRYGYELTRKKCVKDLMNENPLIVDVNDSIEKVSRKALMRPQSSLYDVVVVTKNESYFGVVTVKDLLETAVTIQVHRAVEVNPLTGLSGNTVIDKKLEDIVDKCSAFSIAYMDLDNFKAYNDAYGFNNGDLMIQALAESMRESCVLGEFLGHIGGDDFVLITDYWEIEPLLDKIISCFQNKIKCLYNEEDYKRGYILSKNRRGEPEQFPLATISIAVINNRERKFSNMNEFSECLVKTKKGSKSIIGNSYVFN